MANKTKVFVLAVGIDDYPAAPLSGCVNDAQNILAYLQKDEALDVEPLTLFNEQATKSAIAGGFRTHLARAKAGEAALFYFSGHGAQEWADAMAWPNESDQCLETIACYDPDTGAVLMADKELRYLIGELANGTPGHPKGEPPHILTIFDCCHSGDNTRSAAFMEKAPAARQKRFTKVFPQRSWSDFLFAGQFTKEDFATRPIAELLPEGRHIQMAASLDRQPALEVRAEGLFTKNLLAVLRRTGGSISYASLHSLVSNYIRHQYQQNPQLYVQGGDPGLMYSGFLGRKADAAGRLQGLVSFSPAKGWLLDAGAMHGISRDARLRMKVEGGKWEAPTIRELEPNVAFLDVEPEVHARLDKNKAYPCEVSASYPLRVQVADAEGNEGLHGKLLSKLKEHSARIQLAEYEAEADYVLHNRHGKLYITPAFQACYPQAALADVTTLGEEKAMAQAIRQLEHIANWEFVRRLHNASVHLFKKPPVEVKVAYEKDGQWVALPYQEKGAAVDGLTWKPPQNTYGARLKVELANNFGQDLYFSLLFLTINFESNAGLMEKPVDLIKKGETVTIFAHRGGVIPFNVEQQIFDYNQAETHLWFQLIVSTQENIEVPPLLMPELAPPPSTSRRRGIPLDDEAGSADARPDDWTTQLVHIAFKNPRYDATIQDNQMNWFLGAGDEHAAKQ
ncbi:MAG: caspase family protein [Phaeodactylibacter sp.]|nr:caspase family protein [Phaeodactylibacter sp.]MCB9277012.1 caspase family protein [Lewinellaceae bacterium]